jgi:hypothetical protein
VEVKGRVEEERKLGKLGYNILNIGRLRRRRQRKAVLEGENK